MMCLIFRILLFVMGCTAMPPFGPGLPIPPNVDAVQTANAGLQTAVPQGTQEAPVDVSTRYVPFPHFPLPPCCPSNGVEHAIRCRHCDHTTTALPTPTQSLGLPWFNNFTVPAPTASHTRSKHTTGALNATAFTVVSTITTSANTDTDFLKTHTMCIFWEGIKTGGRDCLTQIDDNASSLHKVPVMEAPRTKTAPPTTLATVPTVPNPSGSPPFVPHWTHRHGPVCTKTVTIAVGLLKDTAATTVTATAFMDCQGCALETKTNDLDFGHGPVSITATRGVPPMTATKTVTECSPMPIID